MPPEAGDLMQEAARSAIIAKGIGLVRFFCLAIAGCGLSDGTIPGGGSTNNQSG